MNLDPMVESGKAQEICGQQTPELVDRGAGHPVACHFPLAGVLGSMPPVA
jgi:hypothetical protein